jgi:hypothetical protein
MSVPHFLQYQKCWSLILFFFCFQLCTSHDSTCRGGMYLNIRRKRKKVAVFHSGAILYFSTLRSQNPISIGFSLNLKDWSFFEKNLKNGFLPRKWLNRRTNGTIRKCSSRHFQWMVMSVYFDNLKFLRPTLGDRSRHQSVALSLPQGFEVHLYPGPTPGINRVHQRPTLLRK